MDVNRLGSVVRCNRNGYENPSDRCTYHENHQKHRKSDAQTIKTRYYLKDHEHEKRKRSDNTAGTAAPGLARQPSLLLGTETVSVHLPLALRTDHHQATFFVLFLLVYRHSAKMPSPCNCNIPLPVIALVLAVLAWAYMSYGQQPDQRAGAFLSLNSRIHAPLIPQFGDPMGPLSPVETRQNSLRLQKPAGPRRDPLASLRSVCRDCVGDCVQSGASKDACYYACLKGDKCKQGIALTQPSALWPSLRSADDPSVRHIGGAVPDPALTLYDPTSPLMGPAISRGPY